MVVASPVYEVVEDNQRFRSFVAHELLGGRGSRSGKTGWAHRTHCSENEEESLRRLRKLPQLTRRLHLEVGAIRAG